MAPLNTKVLSREVLRPLGDRPILSRLIQIASQLVVERSQVVVLTDDDEVVLLSERNGCTAFTVEAQDGNGLKDVNHILAAVEHTEEVCGRNIDTVIILYPTVPLVAAEDLRCGLETLLDSDTYRTVISACETTHRSWKFHEGSYVLESMPIEENIDDTPSYREIPSFVISYRNTIADQGDLFGIHEKMLIEEPVGLSLMPPERTWEIRSVHDWWGLDRLVRRKRIVFVVKGNPETGLGHVYRTTLIAQDLVGHEILFVTVRGHDMASENLRSQHFPVIRQGNEDLVDTVLSLDPQIVINDILATDKEYIGDLKSKGITVVNFEDLGSGADIADLVINAIYEEQDIGANHLNGPMYFCLRDEFFQTDPAPFRKDVEEVLVTFGGTDANNLVKRVVGLVLPIVVDRGIRLSIVTGPGYVHLEELNNFLACQPQKGVELANGTKRISDYMTRADIAFSSAGRTVFELASMLIPSVIIASHEREERHTFASEVNGMKYIGRHDIISDQKIVHAFMELLDCTETRYNLYERAKSVDVKNGRERVISALMRVIKGV